MMQPNKFLQGRAGVYGIYNPDVGKIYVGKTTDMTRRCAQYRYDFEHDRMGHLNDYLRAAMHKHGFDSFVFFPLEFCPTMRLAETELKWMQKLKSTDRRFGYNLRMDSSSGMTVCDSTREKIKANLVKQWASGMRSGHSEKMKAKWQSDPERRRKQGEAFSALKTKFIYLVKPPRGRTIKVLYQRLADFGLKSAVSSMHKAKTDSVVVKGYRVTRRLIEDDER